MLNRVTLVGRLTRDPELRHTSGDTAVATFTIAVQREFANANGQREADFINIIVWRKQAENVKQYVGKGSMVSIDGQLRTRTYQDNTGNTRYVTEVVAESVQFLDSRSSNQQGAPVQQQAAPAYQQYEAPAQAQNNAQQPSAPVNDVTEDLPF